MSSNKIELEFGDGQYLFALPLERIDELQRKSGVGIAALFARVLKGCIREPITGQMFIDPSSGEFYAVDIVETLRQGLIGGGRGTVDGAEVKVTPLLANQLVRNYVQDRPLADSWSLAASVLGACIVGYDPPKKDQPPSEGADSAPAEQTTEA